MAFIKIMDANLKANKKMGDRSHPSPLARRLPDTLNTLSAYHSSMLDKIRFYKSRHWFIGERAGSAE